uniref:Uncharacterized protein n=1 Tax=Enterovibrio norvegicus TaxID=188144 RepID=A0A0H3ZW74_9GAMM|nr:hypothetical protein [Enterovibrio norvegicus]
MCERVNISNSDITLPQSQTLRLFDIAASVTSLMALSP